MLAVKISLYATLCVGAGSFCKLQHEPLRSKKSMFPLLRTCCPCSLPHIGACCSTELSKCLLMAWLVRNQFTTLNTYIHTVLPKLVILLKLLSSCNFSLLLSEETSQGMRAIHAGFPPVHGSLQPLVTSFLLHFLLSKSSGSLLPFDLHLGKNTYHEAEHKAWILHGSNLSYQIWVLLIKLFTKMSWSLLAQWPYVLPTLNLSNTKIMSAHPHFTH